MTPEMKKHLEAVVVAIANEQADDAKSEFSKYLRLKTQSILVGESAEEVDAEDKEEKDDKKEEKSEDKDDKSEEKSEKKDKKEEKKDKKEDKDEDKDEDKE